MKISSFLSSSSLYIECYALTIKISTSSSQNDLLQVGAPSKITTIWRERAKSNFIWISINHNIRGSKNHLISTWIRIAELRSITGLPCVGNSCYVAHMDTRNKVAVLQNIISVKVNYQVVAVIGFFTEASYLENQLECSVQAYGWSDYVFG